jgi:hypothetical protein
MTICFLPPGIGRQETDGEGAALKYLARNLRRCSTLSSTEMGVFWFRRKNGSPGWSNPRVAAILDARGRSPMCDQVARPLLDRGAGGRSPGFLFSRPLLSRREGAATLLDSREIGTAARSREATSGNPPVRPGDGHAVINRQLWPARPNSSVIECFSRCCVALS